MMAFTPVTLTQGGTKPTAAPATPSNFPQELEQTLVEKKWNERWEDNIDSILPNNCLQTSLDEFGCKIEELLRPAHEFSNWIDQSEEGWFKNLSLSLVKLPLAAVRNILRMVYNIAKALVYMAVHPVKFLVEALHFLTELIKSLANPATYTKLGSGIVGSSLAQMVFTGGLSPHVYMGLALGGALLGLGLVAGGIVAVVKGESLGATTWKQLKAIPEFMLTGFLIGLAVGAIKQLIVEKHVVIHNDPAAREFVDRYLQSLPKDYPSPTAVQVLPDGTIVASWKGADLTQFAHTDPTLMDNFNARIIEFNGNGVEYGGSTFQDFNLAFYRPDNLNTHPFLSFTKNGTTNMVHTTHAGGGSFGFQESVHYSEGVHYPTVTPQPTTALTMATSIIPEWVPYISGSAAVFKPSNED